MKREGEGGLLLMRGAGVFVSLNTLSCSANFSEKNALGQARFLGELEVFNSGLVLVGSSAN